MKKSKERLRMSLLTKKKNNSTLNKLDLSSIFQGKKLPLLILDERWHSLFPEYNKPSNIKAIESQMNVMIKQQGKIASDMKLMKQTKSKLMQDIITHMDVNETKEGKLRAKLLDKNQKSIKDITSKMKDMEDEIVDIPYQIKELNESLVIESSIVCYERIKTNNKNLSLVNEEIEKLREELKEKILEKQDMEMKSTEIYSYMHDMFGHDILEKLDDVLK